MFVIIATKPLNDGTRGFRFNYLGAKGLIRIRKYKSRGLHIFQRSECMTAHHIGRFTLYLDHKRNNKRKLNHFAG